MWLRQELGEIKIDSLSVRQQLDLLQNNEYLNCNVNHLVQSRLSFVQSDKNTTLGLSTISRLQQEITIVWNNIYSYIATYFPLVWSEVQKDNFFPNIPIISRNQFDIKEQDSRINSFRHFIEVCKTLVYRGTLRLPFSQNIALSNIFQKLLHSCQLSDRPGKNSIAEQRRIIFLQNWQQKLVLRKSLLEFLKSKLIAVSPRNNIKKGSALVTESKSKSYIARKINIQTLPVPHLKTEVSHQSLSSVETTFSSYLHRQNLNPPTFIGLKLKFDTDESEDNCSTINSEDSIWEPTFKKRKT